MTRSVPVILVALVLLMAVPCFASESFTLDIPTRGNPQQETGEVRITLTLNASPAGAQLVVNGATTLNLGDTKAQILKSAVDAFVSTWRQLDQQEPTGEEWPKDRLGLEFFNQGPLPQTFPSGDPPANFFVQRGAAIPGNWEDIINGVNTLS